MLQIVPLRGPFQTLDVRSRTKLPQFPEQVHPQTAEFLRRLPIQLQNLHLHPSNVSFSTNRFFR